MEKDAVNKSIKAFFTRMLDIRQEQENEQETIESIKKGVEFKGTNLWVLIFATFIASLGLNTNSRYHRCNADISADGTDYGIRSRIRHCRLRPD